MQRILRSANSAVPVLLFFAFTAFGQTINWVRNYDEAKLAALDQSKLLLLYFDYGPPGLWQTKMDVETWSDPKIIELSNRLVCCRDFKSGKSGIDSR